MTPDEGAKDEAVEASLAEPPLTEFANELTAAAEDAAQILSSRVEFNAAGAASESGEQSLNLQTILRIPVTMKVVVGSATLHVSELKRLKKGDTVPLDRRVGENVDIVVNGQIVARGTLVIVDDETARLGVALKEIVDASQVGGEAANSRRR